MGELNAEPSSSRWTLDSTLSGGKQPLIQDACFEETRYASRSFPNADTEVSASETQKRRIGSGPGWQPPSEMAGSTLPWIGGGAQGGVPDRSGPRAKDLTALGADLWSTLGKTVSSTSSGGSIPANMPQNGTHPSSSSSNASTFVVDDPGKYDLTSASFVCRALSECEPCPASTRNHPFCRPYGNRRLVSCEVLREPSAPGPSGASSSKPQPPSDAEFVGWEACGKVVRNETRDYLEFVMILVLLALAGLTLLIRRNREVALRMRTDPDYFQRHSPSSAASAGGGASSASAERRRARRAGRTR